MRRNLKTLGLALVAVFALSAVAASAASAEVATFTSGSNATTLTAEAKTAQVFTEEGLEISCKKIDIDVTVGTDQTSITAEPKYTECTLAASGLGEFTAEIDFNGCHYTFTAGNKTDGTVHLVCPEGVVVEATAFILGKFRKCIQIPGGQNNLTVDYINTTEFTGGKNVWDVDILSTAENIKFNKTGSCGSASGVKAEYHGTVTVWGEDSEGNPVDVTWDPET